MTHKETSKKLKEIPLLVDFNRVLDACTLSTTEKTIIQLHYLEKHDFREIGFRLGYTESRIKQMHHAALRKIAFAL